MKKLLLLVATFVAATGMAADTLWTGVTDNDWGTSGNWTNGVPGTADNAWIVGGTPSISTTPSSINNLILNQGTLAISADFTAVGGAMGDGGSASDVATINQTDGAVSFTGWAAMGLAAGTYEYKLSGGSLTLRSGWDHLARAAGSTFTFTQTGGTFEDPAGGGLVLADQSGTVADVNVSAGSFTVNDQVWAGINGSATFDISGTGALDAKGAVGSTFFLGHGVNGTGTLKLSDTATFGAANELRVGESGTGLIEMSGGTLSGASAISLGRLTGSEGTVNLTGGTFGTTGYGMFVGYAGEGEFNQDGGDVNINIIRMAYLDDAAAAVDGLYSISGGTLTVDGYLKGGGSGAGVFEVDGSGSTSIEVGQMLFTDDTLRFLLDAGGSTLMEDHVSGNLGIELDGATLEVDTLTGFTGTVGSFYDVMWTEDGFITTGATTVSNLGSTEFEWSIVSDGGSGEYLRLTVIPEPATLGMVVAMGGSLLFIRRRFMI